LVLRLEIRVKITKKILDTRKNNPKKIKIGHFSPISTLKDGKIRYYSYFCTIKRIEYLSLTIWGLTAAKRYIKLLVFVGILTFSG